MHAQCHLDGFLADPRDPEADQPLAVEEPDPLIQHPGAEHMPVHGAQGVGVDAGDRSLGPVGDDHSLSSGQAPPPD
jgi:hypothetical protein